MTPSSCCSPCSTIETTQVPGPQGGAGVDGVSGINGISAFTLVTVPFTVPMKNSSVTAIVGNSAWATIGQPIFVETGGTFEVVSIPSPTTLQLKYLNYVTNTEELATVAIGSGVSTGGFNGANATVPDNQTTAYGSGTAYTLTNAAAAVVLGTSSPTLTLTVAGTWLILARVRVDNVGATYSANRTVTAKLRETTGPTDVANGSAAYQTGIKTTDTSTGMVMELPPVIYKTANTTDTISIFASIDTLPSAGSTQITQCEIVAVRLSNTTA